MSLFCSLFGHRDRPHRSATPEHRRLGVQCSRCLRVVLDAPTADFRPKSGDLT